MWLKNFVKRKRGKEHTRHDIKQWRIMLLNISNAVDFFVPLPKSYECVAAMALKFLSLSCNVKSSNSDPLEKGKNFLPEGNR